MKKLSFVATVMVMLIGVSCSPKHEPDTPVTPTPQDTIPTQPKDTLTPEEPNPPIQAIDSFYLEDMSLFESNRHEKYRPQIHFTPAKNWINDPNGLVWRDGLWHLCYQYNPSGNGWGNMSWGHSTSTDLVHWTEQPVALVRDGLGDIFSGSSVVDFDNRAGFGQNAIISYYTSAGNGGQQQSMAYSLDGLTWSREGIHNPIIPNPLHDDNCRDPKVFYDSEHDQYVMTLAHGWHMGAEIWISQDMKSWTLSDSVNCLIPGRPSFQWECPDLVYLPYRDDPSRGEWVMIVSMNPGGPVQGSGMMYLFGHWDGAHFTVSPDNRYPLWLDFGPDCYAGVTWSNTPDDRKVMIAWMSNWDYAGLVPCKPWCSAMTLPRELCLVEKDGQKLISSLPVAEMEALAGEWREWPVKGDTLATMGNPAAYEAEISFPADENVRLTFRTSDMQRIVVNYLSSSRTLSVLRSSGSGVSPNNFAQNIQAKLYGSESVVTLRFIIDQSSMEIFSEDGTSATTVLCFPDRIYHQILRSGPVISFRTRRFESVWK
ncbi:MAG: glycoside hydrolase family 32 protein [Paludibacteraceae bacterium]|nr:glycoside hydrolase family 32 protein [Paludibacteraceae bacterium]